MSGTLWAAGGSAGGASGGGFSGEPAEAGSVENWYVGGSESPDDGGAAWWYLVPEDSGGGGGPDVSGDDYASDGDWYIS